MAFLETCIQERVQDAKHHSCLTLEAVQTLEKESQVPPVTKMTALNSFHIFW
jgi:hypothetical protein